MKNKIHGLPPMAQEFINTTGKVLHIIAPQTDWAMIMYIHYQKYHPEISGWAQMPELLY